MTTQSRLAAGFFSCGGPIEAHDNDFTGAECPWWETSMGVAPTEASGNLPCN